MSDKKSSRSDYISVSEMMDNAPDRKLFDTADKCFDSIWRASNKDVYADLDSIDFLMEPDVFYILCEFLARGGTMREVILKLGINVHDFYERLNKNSERLSLWQSALVRREETIRETAISTHMNIVDADIRDMYDDAGNLLSIQELPNHIARAIKKITYKEGGIQTIELYDKQRSADSLRKAILIEKSLGKSNDASFFDIIRRAEEKAAKQRDKKERLISVD